MSRVGNNPILVPEDVTIDVTENVISVKGKLGELKQDFSGVLIKIDNGIITVERVSESKENKSKHGLYRALINNMIIGVSKGWMKELELVGVGYRAKAQGQKLDLAVGLTLTSRLGCQVVLTDNLDGLIVSLPFINNDVRLNKKKY